MNASLEDLEKTDDVGTKIAKSIYDFLRDENNKKLIADLKNFGLKFQDNTQTKTTKISDKTFVFTGELQELTREQAQLKVEELGAKAINSVSKNTDFLVAGENAGSKLQKAKNLNVKILSEQEFLKILKEL